jgi:hypothetical protein
MSEITDHMALEPRNIPNSLPETDINLVAYDDDPWADHDADVDDPEIIELSRQEEVNVVLQEQGLGPDRPYYTFHDVRRLARLLVDRAHETQEERIMRIFNVTHKESERGEA